MKKILIIAIIAVVLLAWLFHSKDRFAQKRDQALTVPAVTISPAVQRDVLQQIQAVGNVQPYSTVSVTSQVSGQLLNAGFKEGDMVEKGQVLFQIDPQSFTASLQQAEANLLRDRAQLDNARSQVERNKPLLPKGYVAKQDFEQLLTNEKALQATVKADEAFVTSAKILLDYCTIRSPLSGRTGGVLVHPGNVVTANGSNALVVINQVTPIYVSFTIPENYLSAIQEEYKNHSVNVIALLDKNTNQQVQGTLTFINNDVDTTTGSIQLKATFANADFKLWPGQFVTIMLPVKRIQHALLVPTAAIQAGQKGPYVYLMNDKQQAVYRPVKVGPEIGDYTVINEGVNVKDEVITSGQFNLTDGTKVRVVQPVATNNQTTTAS